MAENKAWKVILIGEISPGELYMDVFLDMVFFVETTALEQSTSKLLSLQS